MPFRPSLSAIFRKGKALSKLQPRAPFSSTAANHRNPLDGNIGARSGLNGRKDFNPDTIENLSNILKDYGGDGTPSAGRAKTFEDLGQDETTKKFMAQMPRWWRKGEVYAPRDLSPYEQKKWRGSSAHKQDVLDILGINPLDNYRNFSMISEFMTSFGRIKHSNETGLRPVNQRKMAKAIRRAIGLGIHPSVHYHPEIMARSNTHIAQQTKATEQVPSRQGGKSKNRF